MAVSKVIFNGDTLIDATTATAGAGDITAPKTAMLADGVMTTGTGSGGGITPTGTKQISITQNGTTTEDVTNYANAEITVNVSGGGVSWDDIAKGTDPNGLITLGSSVTSIREYAFAFHPPSSNSWKVYAPYVTTGAGNEFRGAQRLTHISLPAMTTMMTGYTCYQAAQLQVADLGSIDTIYNSFFTQTTLDTLILRKSSALTTLGNANCFNNTKFANGGTGGTIYIPKALYDHLGDNSSLDYKAASNWVTLNGYGTITWAKLEGSAYESTDWILNL